MFTIQEIPLSDRSPSIMNVGRKPRVHVEYSTGARVHEPQQIALDAILAGKAKIIDAEVLTIVICKKQMNNSTPLPEGVPYDAIAVGDSLLIDDKKQIHQVPAEDCKIVGACSVTTSYCKGCCNAGQVTR